MKKTRNLTYDGQMWGYDYTRKSRRFRKGGFITKAQAEAALLRAKTQQMDIEIGLVKPERARVTFEKFSQDFLEIYSRPNKRSADRDEDSIQHLTDHFKGRYLDEIRTEEIAEYMAARKAEAAPGTCNRELSTLKTMMRLACDWGKIVESPAARVKRFKEPPWRERFLKRDEARRLIEACGPELRPIVETALATGMRRGEILGLTWKDLDFTTGTITLTKTKNGRARKIPMSGEIAATLGAVPRHGEFVFMNGQPGQSITTYGLAFREACRAAGIQGFRFHDLRHSALSWMIEDGIDIVTVAAIAGHSSILMTQKYCHTDEDRKRKAVQALGARLVSARQNPDTGQIAVVPAQPVSATARDN